LHDEYEGKANYNIPELALSTPFIKQLCTLLTYEINACVYEDIRLDGRTFEQVFNNISIDFSGPSPKLICHEGHMFEDILMHFPGTIDTQRSAHCFHVGNLVAGRHVVPLYLCGDRCTFESQCPSVPWMARVVEKDASMGIITQALNINLPACLRELRDLSIVNFEAAEKMTIHIPVLRGRGLSSRTNCEITRPALPVEKVKKTRGRTTATEAEASSTSIATSAVDVTLDVVGSMGNSLLLAKKKAAASASNSSSSGCKRSRDSSNKHLLA
jgi:hypothetical protein